MPEYFLHHDGPGGDETELCRFENDREAFASIRGTKYRGTITYVYKNKELTGRIAHR